MQVGRRIARYADMRNVFNANAGGVQTVAHRFSGKPSAVFDAIESLLFNGRHNSAVLD
jgi:hypothetical protein